MERGCISASDAAMKIQAFGFTNERNYLVTDRIVHTAFKCSRCGVSGEKNFDWQGYCLICEDDDGNDCMQLDQYEECEL